MLHRFVLCKIVKVLSRGRAQKYGIDLDVAAANLQKLKAVAPAVQTIFAELAAERRSNDAAAPSADPDRSLYSGFASSGDKARFVQIRSMMPEHLAAEAPNFVSTTRSLLNALPLPRTELA